MRLLIPEARDAVPRLRTARTFSWLDHHRAELEAAGFEILIEHCGLGWTSYGDKIVREWERTPREGFMILEHDVVPDCVQTLVDLASCAQRICFVPFEAHTEYWPPDRGRPSYMGTSCSRGLCTPHPTAWFLMEGGVQRDLLPTDTRAHQTGFGLIKFGRQLLEEHPRLDWPAGTSLDGKFYTWLRASGRVVPAHVHHPTQSPVGWMLVHTHYKCAGDV